MMHISSLPSDYGIGTMGKEAYGFVDFLKQAGQSYWQVLPICPPDEVGSSYKSCSTFAGNPCFIDLDLLESSGYLQKSDYDSIDWGKDEASLDFDKVNANRLNVLKIAYKNWIRENKKSLVEFSLKNKWAKNYSLFMALYHANDKKPWWEWDDPYKFRDERALDEFQKSHEDEINFWLFTQCIFFEQWYALKKYANSNGVGLIGDLPIYVDSNSAGVWTEPENFCLDGDMKPSRVAGCPPDQFSKSGQCWGNPLYNWDKMKKNDYEWWCERFKIYETMYDIIRIDHFRGFDSYYSIDAKDNDAANGVWVQGPGLDFFKTVEKKLGKLKIIAEDLGHFAQSVVDLLKNTGFPGMKVLEFAFDTRAEIDYMPHNYDANSVVYVGTHDNDTAIGWFRAVEPEIKELCLKYLNIGQFEGINWGMIRGAMASVSKLSIIQMQDFLGLGSEARMNTPSTVKINWKWRMKKGALTSKLAKKIHNMTKLYGRI